PEMLAEFLNSLEFCSRAQLSMGGGTDSFVHCSTTNPKVSIEADDLAYVAFTSGSTGLPKGVMGRHGPLTLFTACAVETFGLNNSDRFCMLSGLAHDPLHRDIFTPLQLGGIVSIPDPACLEAPDRLRAWLRQRECTIENFTAVMAQLLCDLVDASVVDEPVVSLCYVF